MVVTTLYISILQYLFMIISNKQKFRTDEKVLVECDFKISLKCKGVYFKIYKNILKCRENNEGKDRCQYCFNAITKSGKNNYNFKYFSKASL